MHPDLSQYERNQVRNAVQALMNYCYSRFGSADLGFTPEFWIDVLEERLRIHNNTENRNARLSV